jgi:hypothetical protein
MRRSALFFCTFAAALSSACDGPVTHPLATSAGSSMNEAGVVQSAGGGAHRWTGGQPFILSFEANKRADGTVTGRYHVDFKVLSARFDVVVTCLSVVGNRAWVGGIIEKTDSPLVQVGTSSYFWVIDRGEGANGGIAPPDIISALILNDVPNAELQFCADRPVALPSRPIDDGNIRVRD